MTTEAEDNSSSRANEEFNRALDRATGEDQYKVTSRDIQFVFDVMKKEAPYDETSIKQLFYGCSSAFTKLPIHHNVNSRKSGAGKTYVLILVSGYFPNRYVLSFVGMSDKALVHEQGIQVIIDEETGNTIQAESIIEDHKRTIEELERKIDDPKNKDQKKELKRQIGQQEKVIKEIYSKCEKLIILDNRIILMLDTAQEGLYNTLMSMISQDTTRDQIYQFTDKKGGSGRLGASKNRLRGTPALFTTQVIDDSRQVRYQEKNRRFIHVTPDTSSKKVAAAKNLIGQKFGMLPDEYDELVLDNADKERAKEIVSIIVDKLIDHSELFKPKESGVKIAFTDSISHAIGGNEMEWSMTVMDRTMRYLVVITKVNMDSRPRIIDTETGRFYPISTFADLKETLQLMQVAASTARPYQSDWYNRVFLPAFRELGGVPNAKYSDSGMVVEKEIYVGLTTEQLVNRTFDVMKLAINRRGIRDQFIYPLSNMGIINYVKSSINGNELICSPVEEDNIFSIFNDEDDLRLKVKDSALYPSRKLLEESFRTIVKQEDSEGILKLKNKFRLVDEYGVDITVDELIDRYLDNPEICFKSDNNETSTNETNENDNEEKNNLSPPGCPPDLSKNPKNEIEQFTKGRYSCRYCEVKGHDIKFDNEKVLIDHHINRHVGWSYYDDLDFEKFKAQEEAV